MPPSRVSGASETPATRSTVITMTATAQNSEYARMFGRDETAPIGSGEDILVRVATLKTATIRVEVNELSWKEPGALIFRVNRPTCSLLVSASADSIETGYVGEGVRKVNNIGSVVFTPPDREILSRCHSAGKLRVVTCSFDREYSERVVGGSLADLSRSQLLSCLNVRSSLLPAILLRLMSEALSPGFVSTAVAESLGQAMLVECSHVLLCEDPKQEGRGRLTPRHFRIIDEYLAGLSCEAPSIAAIAAACGMSERYLTKLFREQTDQSLGQYLKCVQIAKARAYLLETNLPLKEISYRLGFSTPANFSIAFRAATGETPGRFRAANCVSDTKGSERTN